MSSNTRRSSDLYPPQAPPGPDSPRRQPPESDPGDRPRLDLSVAQVVGSVLAAVSATVVTARFGVAGTVVGAALASTVATVGTALYAHFFRAGRTALVESGARLLTGDRSLTAGPRNGGRGPRLTLRRPRRPVLALAVAPLVVCALALAGITAVEALAGRTLSGLVGGQQRDTAGTSIGHIARSVEGSAVRPVRGTRSTEPTVSPTSGRPPSAGPSLGGAAPASPSAAASAPPATESSPAASSPPEPSSSSARPEPSSGSDTPTAG